MNVIGVKIQHIQLALCYVKHLECTSIKFGTMCQKTLKAWTAFCPRYCASTSVSYSSSHLDIKLYNEIKVLFGLAKLRDTAHADSLYNQIYCTPGVLPSITEEKLQEIPKNPFNNNHRGILTTMLGL